MWTRFLTFILSHNPRPSFSQRQEYIIITVLFMLFLVLLLNNQLINNLQNYIFACKLLATKFEEKHMIKKTLGLPHMLLNVDIETKSSLPEN